MVYGRQGAFILSIIFTAQGTLALNRAPGGAISQINTYRAGGTTPPASTASYDSATGQFSGSATASVSYDYDANAR